MQSSFDSAELPIPSRLRARAASLSFVPEAVELQDRSSHQIDGIPDEDEDSISRERGRRESSADDGSEEQEADEHGSLRPSPKIAGFEAPKAREGLVMIVSVVLVLVMALAAGLTTVYDWVL